MNISLPRLLVTGGSGQLAHALHHHPRAREFHLILCTHTNLDITNMKSINEAIDKHKPDFMINTAAYTAVDKAESDYDNALRVNQRGCENLAIACAQHQIPLFHLSTDYVFDGTKKSPYTEDDATNPINVYGQSKWLGEQIIREQCKQHLILRVSGIFSAYGNNFFNTMHKNAKNNPSLRVVADQITCPTYAGDIAETLYKIASNFKKPGTYHYCSTPATSWHQFAQAILDRDIEPINSSEYATAAKRPAYSVLDCTKILSEYDIEQPSWEKAVWSLK